MLSRSSTFGSMLRSLLVVSVAALALPAAAGASSVTSTPIGPSSQYVNVTERSRRQRRDATATDSRPPVDRRRPDAERPWTAARTARRSPAIAGDAVVNLGSGNDVFNPAHRYGITVNGGTATTR